MATLNILQYPDPRLRIKAKPVEDFGAETQQYIADLLETMYNTPNTAGLAATQVSIPFQIVGIDLSATKDQLLLLINPEIIEKSKETTYEPEACLSVPGDIYEPVTRAAAIKVANFTAQGERYEFECDGFLAKCIQHEMDHLQGMLFIDYLSPLKRRRIDKKLEKLRKLEAA